MQHVLLSWLIVCIPGCSGMEDTLQCPLQRALLGTVRWRLGKQHQMRCTIPTLHRHSESCRSRWAISQHQFTWCRRGIERVGYKHMQNMHLCLCCFVVRRGEDWQRPKSQHQISGTVTKVHRTNPGTEAEPQQIVAQGYSHAYSTTFHS